MSMARKLPLLTAETEPFWRGGAEGELRIFRCGSCRLWFHPPSPICPTCGSLEVGPRRASGQGRVASFTINHQRWTPELEVPYAIAIVELVEQQGLRFLTNVIRCPPDEIFIGMPVSVVFEQQEDVWLPLFERDASRVAD